MPAYSYSCNRCGAVREVFRLVSQKRPSRLRCRCGGISERDVAADFRSRRATRCTTWPKVADFAFEVNPEQVSKAMAADRAAGVPTEYAKTEEGFAPVWTGPKHKRAFCRAHGFKDRNGGYSDP